MARDVDVLIFTRDRPAQLELLLRSLVTFAGDLYRGVSVLWRWTSSEYEGAYAKVAAAYPRTLWHRESSFERDVRSWLSWAGDRVSFLVDDDVFYRDAPPVERTPWSLRGGDYDYPFSLDGNVYERGHLIRLLDGLRFDDPTELEARGHEQRSRLPFAEVCPSDPPCLVGLPLNRVSPSSGMPHMDVHEYDLNERFLAGARLELIPPGEYGAHEAIVPVFA